MCVVEQVLIEHSKIIYRCLHSPQISKQWNASASSLQKRNSYEQCFAIARQTVSHHCNCNCNRNWYSTIKLVLTFISMQISIQIHTVAASFFSSEKCRPTSVSARECDWKLDFLARFTNTIHSQHWNYSMIAIRIALSNVVFRTVKVKLFHRCLSCVSLTHFPDESNAHENSKQIVIFNETFHSKKDGHFSSKFTLISLPSFVISHAFCYYIITPCD